MPTRTRKAAPAKPKAIPQSEPEELEEELEELENEEFEEVPETQADSTATSKKSRAGADVVFGVAHLAEYLTQRAGKPVTTRELRTLIRRMARETDKPGGPRVNREIVAGNRSRYDWPLGLQDPEVKAIIKAYLGGEAETAKKEALDKLKADNAAKRAAKTPAAAKPTSKKAVAKKAPEPVEEDDEELEFDDED
jgi:hypothetical protein